MAERSLENIKKIIGCNLTLRPSLVIKGDEVLCLSHLIDKGKVLGMVPSGEEVPLDDVDFKEGTAKCVYSECAVCSGPQS